MRGLLLGETAEERGGLVRLRVERGHDVVFGGKVDVALVVAVVFAGLGTSRVFHPRIIA